MPICTRCNATMERASSSFGGNRGPDEILCEDCTDQHFTDLYAKLSEGLKDWDRARRDREVLDRLKSTVSNGPWAFNAAQTASVVAMRRLPDGAGEPYHCGRCGFFYERLWLLGNGHRKGRS